MKPRIRILIASLALLFPAASVAQRPALKPARRAKAPLQVASGLMTGNRIEVRRTDWIREGAPLFEYAIAGAAIVEGRLELTGTLREAGGQQTAAVRATMLSTTARSANPWPSAASATARERAPARNQPEGERNEQTQSLYSGATETGSGCELLYLKLTAPFQREPLQIGVVLAPRDNARGIEINQALCRVARAIKTGADLAEPLGRLNQLLSQKS
ncbi:MAG: hypothetical protein SF339_28060 [Blastocatellia bacterium]|nr:hypothetical protein [Blastocatellia bacterium]